MTPENSEKLFLGKRSLYFSCYLLRNFLLNDAFYDGVKMYSQGSGHLVAAASQPLYISVSSRVMMFEMIYKFAPNKSKPLFSPN